MKLSVFTPTHDTRWLDDAYQSLLKQTHQDWEWIVLLNGEAATEPTTWPRWFHEPLDPRIEVHRATTRQGIGALKGEACSFATGDVLVELDHDDRFATDDALERIALAFVMPTVSFVYSDTRQINEDGTPNGDRFNPDHGWEYVDGVAQSMEPYPHNVSYIWYAPNHVRAFRRDAYEAVGGYNPNLAVCDDHDLMVRLYQAGSFRYLNEPLYEQRIHNNNTQKDPLKNAEIQRETVRIYDENVQANALAWAKRLGLSAFDLGGAHNSPEGYEPIDIELGVEALWKLRRTYTDSVGVIRAVDFLEHHPQPIPFLNEAYRVLHHGGMLLTMTPSTDGRGAFQDPTHVSFWNENSWWYYTDENYAKYVPAIRCRFQVSRIFTYYPSEWHEANRISYVCCNLIAIKDGPRQGGILKI